MEHASVSYGIYLCMIRSISPCVMEQVSVFKSKFKNTTIYLFASLFLLVYVYISHSK